MSVRQAVSIGAGFAFLVGFGFVGPLLRAAKPDETSSVAPSEAEAPERIPVIFDSDFGSGAEDALALATLIASERFELLAVTTSGADAADRAWIACRFLSSAGLASVPVAAGSDPQPGPELGEEIQYRRHPAVVWGRTSKPEENPAEDVIARVLEERFKEGDEKGVAIVAGDPGNLERLFELHPNAASRIARIAWTGERGAAADSRESVDPARDAVPRPFDALLAKTRDGPTAPCELDDAALTRVFAAHTALTHEVETLAELARERRIPLRAAAAVRAALEVDGERPGAASKGDRERSCEPLATWCERTISGFGRPVLPSEPPNVTAAIIEDALPRIVHAFEDWETEIESRWWLAGIPERNRLPEGSRRVCRAVITQDFDDLQGDSRTRYKAVVFNPVPGPPMGDRPRLRFRCRLHGTDSLRVQIFSLSNGYHRCLTLRDLPEDRWSDVTVDMTRARRPDGTGGPLARDERIDDVQFYVDPRADLWIDRFVLYDASNAGDAEPFPERILFTGWFDTGEQGREWPGDFEIVPHGAPLTWDAARSVLDSSTERPWIRLDLRGPRRLGETTRLRFRYRIEGGDRIDVELGESESGFRLAGVLRDLETERWRDASLDFRLKLDPSGDGDVEEGTDGGGEKKDGERTEGTGDEESSRTPAEAHASEIRFRLPAGATLWIDDVLLYEPRPTGADPVAPQSEQRRAR